MAIVAQQGQQNDPNNQEQNKQGQPQTLAGSTQSVSPGASSGRIASFSSGSQPQASGRFTNLQKYMDANKSSSENLGARAGGQFNREFNKGQTDINKQNEQIAQGFQSGRSSLNQGAGYQGQLNQIGQGLNTFQTIDNRGDFDTAGQQAQTLAQDTNYGTLASGNAIDQAALQNQQAAALQASQNLLNTNQQNLQNLQTNQGRDQLLGNIIPKQGYSAGQRSFDKLFLTGNVLSGLQSNLSGKQGLAQGLLSSTGAQQGTLDTLTSDEAKIVGDLTKQAQANQDLFNAKFGNMQNIADVNAARNQRFSDLKNALSTGGAISQEDMTLLGLDTLGNTFVNENSTTGGKIGTYNLLKDPSNINKYITQGADANTIQDITTQGDFDTYKALQNLALGRDTGLLSGISTLGNSVNRVGDLAGDITAADKAFRTNYGDKTYQAAATNYGNEYRDNLYGSANFGVTNSADTTTPSSLQDYLNQNATQGNQSISNFINTIRTLQSLGGTPEGDFMSLQGNTVDKGATSVAQANLADYLKNNNINTASQGLYDQNKYAGNYIQDSTTNQVKSDVQNRLENILNTEGTRNVLTAGDDKNYRRFRGLV